MRDNKKIVLLALCFVFTSVAWSQDFPTRTLATATDWKITESASGMIWPFNVQVANSSIYFRRFDAPLGAPENHPITKIGPDGKESLIDLREIPGVQDKIYPLTYFVNSDGSVIAVDLFYKENVRYLVSYDSTGKFQWKVPMSQQIQIPNVVVPFDGGRLFLVSGTVSAPGDVSRGAITAMFDRSGKMIQEYTLSTDGTSVEIEMVGRKNTLNPMALAAVDSDGSAYLLWQSLQPKVQVFSPAGEWLRVLDLTPPKDARLPLTMFADHGQITVIYPISVSPDASRQVRLATPNIVTYDSNTGKTLAITIFHGLGVPLSLRDGKMTFLNKQGDYFSVGHSSLN